MKLIKLAIISVIGLFVVIWLISLLIPPTVRVSRALDISVAKDSVVPAVANLQQWQYWNELVNHDGLTNRTYSPTAIKADQLLVTKQAIQGDTLLTTWKQQNGRVITGGFTWHGNSNRMVLQWFFEVRLRWYPWEKFSSIVFDKQLGPPMEKSLANLKNLLEKGS